MRNHREEIETALAGGAPRLVPFTFYSGLFPPGFDPAPLQARGLALCVRRGTMKVVRRLDANNRTILDVIQSCPLS